MFTPQTPFLPLTLVAFLALALLSGCQSPASSGQTSPAVIPAEAPPPVFKQSLAEGQAFVVQPEGAAGPAQVYDRLSGAPVWSLPAGRLAAGGSIFVAAAQDRYDTHLTRYAADAERAQKVARVDGLYMLGAVSADGKWAALVAYDPKAAFGEPARLTFIQVVDTESGEELREIGLKGDFEVEAIDNKASALFLIEHLREEGETHYVVRVFDLRNHQLDPNPLRDKRFFDEVMTGYAWGTAASPDGRWLLTLYLNTAQNAAFIHVLNVQDRWSLCLELPSDIGESGDLDILKQYSMTLAAGGTRVVAANPLLGVLAELDLEDLEHRRVFEFEPAAAAAEQAERMPAGVSRSDGSAVFFSYDRALWRFEPAAGAISGPLTFDERIVGLGAQPEGDGLLVALAQGGVELLAADGAFAPGDAVAGK